MTSDNPESLANNDILYFSFLFICFDIYQTLVQELYMQHHQEKI